MKMTRFAVAAAVAGLALGAAMPASAATTLTFEGQFNTIYTAPITRSGYEVGNPVGQEQHFHEIDSTQFGLASNGTGVLLNDRDTDIFLQEVGGGAFALTSFDIAAAFNNSPGNAFVVSGYLGGNLVGTVVGALGEFATFGGFGNVDYVVFDGTGGGGGFELDNIVLDGAMAGAVPEPTTWAMMVGGLALVGASMRRRKVAVSFA
jgi:hypothetical protein